MPRRLPPFDPPLGPFTKGMNNVVDARLLAADAAVTAQNVDLTTGALRPLLGPGSQAAIGAMSPEYDAVDAAYVWIACPSNTHWIGAQERQHVCLDTLDAAYVTNIAAGTAVPDYPRALYNPGPVAGYNSYVLGLTAPVAGLVAVTGGAGGARAYAFTLVAEDGTESNPHPVLGAYPVPAATVVANYVGANLTVPVGVGDARIVARRVYATQANDQFGTKYLLRPVAGGDHTIGDNVTTAIVDGAAYELDLEQPLNWSPGGNIDARTIQYDHSPWPKALVLANILHGATPGAGSRGSGILFGTDDTGFIARWSMVGYPAYCPTVNEHRLPEQTQAIVSQGFQTLYFLNTQIWVFSGEADFAIVRAKSDADRGVREGCGHTVTRTPWGVAFVTEDGVALFDGGRASVITKGVLDPRWLAGLTFRDARYWQGFLWLFHTTGTIILDMRDFPTQLRVITSDKVVLGSWVNPYDFPNAERGLFVMLSGERGFVRRWHPLEALAGSTRLAVTWRFPKWTWGSDRFKHVTELSVDGSGPATLKLYRDDEVAARWTKEVVDLAKRRRLLVGPGFRGRAVSLEVTTAAGADTTIRGIRPEGVVQDGF